jgi:hypothetical protein
MKMSVLKGKNSVKIKLFLLLFYKLDFFILLPIGHLHRFALTGTVILHSSTPFVLCFGRTHAVEKFELIELTLITKLKRI